ncbi:MAG TPA: hypothetical protein VGR35_15655 [Tepidisphaeraceae bacterium]|nr:hypothetical protein [Tepidisphaeraceae bacterium]
MPSSTRNTAKRSGGATSAMGERVNQITATGRSIARKAPAQARRIMKTAKQKASTLGDVASKVAEKVTQAAATAAGAVVGTVQAVMPDHSRSTDSSGSGGSSGGGSSGSSEI